MTRRSAPRLRRELVAELRAKGAIRSDAVEAAFLAVPRERFLPDVTADCGLQAVYRDEAIVTKRDPRGMPLSSSSQPALMAKMLELLAIQPGDRVLEIGTGTGYNAALLRHIVGSRGHVTSVDIDAELVRSARRVLRETGYRVVVSVGDGRTGHAARAPFNRIIVTACADEIPRAWFEQLADDGRLELPLRLDPDGAAIQLIPVLERQGDRLRSVEVTWGGFMPLHGGDGGWRPPPASLGVTHSVAGNPTPLVSITGAGLNQLPTDAKRELIADVLTNQKASLRQGVTDMSSTNTPLLLIFLLLTIPAPVRVSLGQDGRLGVGVIDRRSRSLAVISLRSPWSSDTGSRRTRARWRLDAYGNDTAALKLEKFINDWHRLRRERRTRPEITGRVRAEAVSLHFTWGREPALS